MLNKSNAFLLSLAFATTATGLTMPATDAAAAEVRAAPSVCEGSFYTFEQENDVWDGPTPIVCPYIESGLGHDDVTNLRVYSNGTASSKACRRSYGSDTASCGATRSGSGTQIMYTSAWEASYTGVAYIHITPSSSSEYLGYYASN